MALEKATCVFMALSVLLQVISCRFTCDVSEFKAGVVRCYQSRGVTADAIFAEFAASPYQDVTTLLASLLHNNGTEACNTSRSVYKSAVHCVYQLNRDCNTRLTKGLVANPEDAAKMVDPLCDNLADVDFECVQRQGRSLQACIARQQEILSREGREVILLDGRCYMTNSTAHCAKSRYQSCGCATSRTYSNIVYDLLKPSDCIPGNDTEHRVRCMAGDPQSFISDGLNGGRTVATFLWWLPFLLSALVSGSISGCLRS